tara:strand:+ start:512 stop:664 length:153 start_codon:yes stop_codon:yes gene_type:complete
MLVVLTSNAVHRVRHSDGDVEILGLGLGEAIDTGNVVSDGEVLSEDTGVT